MREHKIEFEGRAKAEYLEIQSDEQLAQIVKEMREYARQTEFDYERAKREVLGQEGNRVTQEVAVDLEGQEGVMLRSRSSTQIGYVAPWTRFIRIGHETLQLTYYEFQVPGQGWIAQTQLCNNYKFPLAEGAEAVAQLFVDEDGPDYLVPDGLPPHVLVIFQAVKR